MIFPDSPDIEAGSSSVEGWGIRRLLPQAS
jgi:hypothetical protein